jgi:hypothetical protein
MSVGRLCAAGRRRAYHKYARTQPGASSAWHSCASSTAVCPTRHDTTFLLRGTDTSHGVHMGEAGAHAR